MPYLALHMSVAREIANDIKHPILDAERGAFYMGSTGPDMRILSRADRTSSHYFDLDRLSEQNAAAAFFEAHVDLADSLQLDSGTTAFVAGYLTHLVIDEIRITDIYRPFFGPGSALGGNARANVLDRVLQYDMDLQRRKDRVVMDDIARQFLATNLALDTALADEATLVRWRGIVLDMISRSLDWERFAKTASRFLAVAGVSTELEIDAFMKTLPSLLAETKAHVGDERLAEFIQKAKAFSLNTLEEYLP